MLFIAIFVENDGDSECPEDFNKLRSDKGYASVGFSGSEVAVNRPAGRSCSDHQCWQSSMNE
jgi:hypothetical protein